MATAKQRSAKAPGERAARQMSEKTLVRLIEDRESKASKAGSFHEDTAEAIRYYLGLPIGNEVEDRSQVVMREVYSTIEWIKPMLLKMFFGGDQVVKFTPKGPEDVKQAEQETDVVHHAVVNQNDGFATLYTWFTDALLSRNSYAVAYWDEREDVTESSYEGLSIEEITMMAQDQDFEVVEAEEVEGEPDETGQPQPAFNIKIRSTEKTGKVCIDTIPPERVLVEAGYKHIGLSRTNFAEYWEDRTISELREVGFDVPDSIADEDDSDGYAAGNDLVENARQARDADWRDDDNDEEGDGASRKVRVRTVFMRVDFDGDGKAEMRRIMVVGKTILSNETYDRVLIAALTPTILPHRHVGMSIADAVMDLQEIKSTLMRGVLDGMYLTLNGRHAINEDTVNIDDLLVTRPGGIVRVAGDPSTAIVPLVTPNAGGELIQTIEYLDNVLENRTGASPRVLQGQSFDGNAINKTATGINAVMAAAMARIELIARVFAETGVKELFQIVHMLLLKHNRKPTVMQLRNEFIEVDPRSWKKRTDMTVEVGLGTGDKQAKIALLQMIATAQQGVMPMGLSNPQTMFNTFAKIVSEAGYKNPEEFFVNPTKPGYQMPEAPMDPAAIQAQAEQAKISLEQEKAKAMLALDQQKIEADFQKSQATMDLERAKAFLGAQVDLAKSILQQQGQAEQAEMEGQREGMRMQREDRVRQEDRGREDKYRREDRRERLAKDGLLALDEAPKAKKRMVQHHYDDAGNIVASELIESDEDA